MAVVDVAVIVFGRHGLAVIVYLVAIMDMFCGRHSLWPSWYRPVTGIVTKIIIHVN